MRCKSGPLTSVCNYYSQIFFCEFLSFNWALFRLCIAVRAGESLMKLVSDIKQYLILNDFHSVNDAISNNSQYFRATQNECDKKLMNLREAAAADLYDLEEDYYTSEFK